MKIEMVENHFFNPLLGTNTKYVVITPPYGERPPIKSYLFTRIITPYIECPSASHEGD